MNSTTSTNNDIGIKFQRTTIPPALLYICDIMMVLTILVGLCGNILICICIIKTRSLRTYINANVVSSSVSNILGCVFLVPIRIYLYNSTDYEYNAHITLCGMAVFFRTLCDTMQLFMLGVVSYERYHAVAHPFKKQSRLSRTIVLILVSWILSVGLSLLSVFLFVDSALYDRCFSEEISNSSHWGRHDLYLLFPLGVITLVLIFCCYGLIIYTLFKHSTTMAKHFNGKKNKVSPLKSKGIKEDIANTQRHSNIESDIKSKSDSKQTIGNTVITRPGDNKVDKRQSLLAKVNTVSSDIETTVSINVSNIHSDIVCNDTSKRLTTRSHENIDQLSSRTQTKLHEIQGKEISLSNITDIIDVAIDNCASAQEKGKEDKNDATIGITVNRSTVANDNKPSIGDIKPSDIKRPKELGKGNPPVIADNVTDINVDLNKASTSNVMKKESISKSPEDVKISTKIMTDVTKTDKISLKEGNHNDSKDILLQQKIGARVTIDNGSVESKQEKTKIEIYDIDGNVQKVSKEDNKYSGSVCLMNSKNREQGRRKVEVRAAKKIAIVIGTFTCCWLPLPLLVISTMSNVPLSLIQQQILVVCGTIATASTAVNPILYAFLNRQINSSMKNMYFRKIMCKNT